MIDEWNEKTRHLREDSTPSQMNNLDTVDQGIAGGPIGESDPRNKKRKKIREDLGGADAGTDAAAFQTYSEDEPKTTTTIKQLVRAKYKRRLL